MAADSRSPFSLIRQLVAHSNGMFTLGSSTSRIATWRMARILAVDDEPDQRFLLRRILEGAGHQVAVAHDGAAALKAVRESPVDLVVTDMMMPVMTGPELIRCLRNDPATGHIPILAVSGDSHLAGAADAVLPKPYRKEDLVAAAETLLRKGHGPK